MICPNCGFDSSSNYKCDLCSYVFTQVDPEDEKEEFYRTTDRLWSEGVTKGLTIVIVALIVVCVWLVIKK